MRFPAPRAIAATCMLSLLTAPLAATWSIVLVDTRTGEVAIGSATCVSGYDLRQLASIVLVGRGAAVAQSYVDFSGRNRVLIWDELKKGTDPGQILVLLAQSDTGHQTRQYGIVDTQGRAIGFTGTGAGAWAGHLTGKVGDIAYAIQGNVITGLPVLTKAEEAIRDTPGDLAAKLMAAMEASRLMGGDGRCSCLTGPPDSCGSPPRNGFTRTAHIGYMIVARHGDSDGVCNANLGCATGTYYLNHNIAFSSPVDPVFDLKRLYDQWRLAWTGRPDHHRSSLGFEPPTLPADGRTSTLATVVLRDWQGVQTTGTSDTLTVTLDASSTAQVQIGAVRNQAPGVYAFPLTAGSQAGDAVLRVEVDDGKGKVLLWPPARLTVSGDALWASRVNLRVSAPSPVGFVLNPGAAHARKGYVLLLSNSGSSPGIRIPPVTIPVNPDVVTELSLLLANTPLLPNSIAALDSRGWSWSALDLPLEARRSLLGTDLTCAFATFLPAVDFASNALVLPVKN